MNIKNLAYASKDGLMIDMEVEHPVFGWIEYTSFKDDVEVLSRDLYEQALASKNIIAEYNPFKNSELYEIEIEKLKSQILELNPNAKFPNDVDINNDGVASIKELQAYLDLLKQRALLNKFEG
jgi:hypothetical protein